MSTRSLGTGLCTVCVSKGHGGGTLLASLGCSWERSHQPLPSLHPEGFTGSLAATEAEVTQVPSLPPAARSASCCGQLSSDTELRKACKDWPQVLTGLLAALLYTQGPDPMCHRTHLRLKASSMTRRCLCQRS